MGYGKDKVVVELIMPNPLTEDNYYAELELPANPSYISDALQRARCFRHGKEKLGVIVTHCERLPLLVNVEFDTPTIEEMDFFARRLASLSEQELLVLDCVLDKRIDSGMYHEGLPMKDLINLTYGLDEVMIASGVQNDEQLGQFVLDNDLHEDVASIPENALYLLDKKKVGELQRKTDGGVFVDGYYVVAGAYEMPDVYDGIHLPSTPVPLEDYIFRLEVAKAPSGDEEANMEQAKWISLPITKEALEAVMKEQDVSTMEDCVYYGFRSAIPDITHVVFDNMQDFAMLNEIAKRYSQMSEKEQITFKAALAHEVPLNMEKVLDVSEHIGEYQMSYMAANREEFFLEHLLHHVDTNYDTRWLRGVYLREEGTMLLDKLGAVESEYGIVSARGGSLYQLVPFEETEEIIEEAEEQTMGGMQL